jgi:acid phosphatase
VRRLPPKPLPRRPGRRRQGRWRADATANDNLNAVLWMQRAEYKAITEQTYAPPPTTWMWR